MCRMGVVREVGGETNSESDIEECGKTVWSKQYHFGSKSLHFLTSPSPPPADVVVFPVFHSSSNDLLSVRLPFAAWLLRTIASSPQSFVPSLYSSSSFTISTSPLHPAVSCSHPNSTSLPCRLPSGCMPIGVHLSSSPILPNTLPTVPPSL